MAEISIFYNIHTFENIANRVSSSILYRSDEKNNLLKMIKHLERIGFLLYAIEIVKQDDFDFQISEYEKLKHFLISEVYDELIAQLVDEYKDYEEVGYSEIRKRFLGMTFDIQIINRIDREFSERGVKVRY